MNCKVAGANVLTNPAHVHYLFVRQELFVRQSNREIVLGLYVVVNIVPPIITSSDVIKL